MFILSLGECFPDVTYILLQAFHFSSIHLSEALICVTNFKIRFSTNLCLCFFLQLCTSLFSFWP